MAEPTIQELTDAMFLEVKAHLGPLYKDDDENVLKSLIVEVRDEAFEVGNRMSATTDDFKDLKSCIFHTSVIGYQNRGIEGQTRQNELGQENHFIDWHNYLRDTVITHGKRFVI